MPYIIETHSVRKDGTKYLAEINSRERFDTKDLANARIVELISEQDADNKQIQEWSDSYWAERLERSLLDTDTDDDDTVVSREPRLYNYSFKAAKYSTRALNNMP